MKKSIVLLIAAILSSGFMFAQTKNVVSAFNYLRKDKLAKAKEAIDPAITNDKTKDDAKTWFYYGNVYLSLQLTEDEEYKSLDENPLDKAYMAYMKALELDTKKQYTDEINDRVQVCAEQYFNRGVNAYTNKDYQKAAGAFAKSATVNQNLGRIDSVAYLYAAQSAYFAEQLELAKENFNILLDLQYQDVSIYRMLADINKTSGDTTAAINILLEGRKQFPDDFNLIIDAANIYLATNQSEEALDVLNLAIERDDSNATLYFAAGTIYDKAGMFDEAVDMYNKALEIDPEYFDANYNLGALYYNRAAEIITKAGDLPLNETEKYDTMLAEGNAMMKKALPYLEKADTIQPADAVTLETLKQIYTRLNMMEKLKAINERIEK